MWAVVSQFEEPCALRLLGVQEQNSLNSASVAFQPIQLQLCSQVWTEGRDEEEEMDGEVRGKDEGSVNKATRPIRHSLTAESTWSNPIMCAHVYMTFH